MLKLLTFVIIAAVNAQSDNKEILTDIPLIGLLAQPIDTSANSMQYILADYSEYFGGSGAKIIPISFKLAESQLRTLMYKLNGVFFPGGGGDFAIYNETTKEWKITQFGTTGRNIIKIAKEINDKGKHYPVWGTCRGFQLLVFVASEDLSLPQRGCDCIDYNAKLNFTPNGEKARMFSAFSKEEIQDFKEKAFTYNYHQGYVDENDFKTHEKLRDLFDVVSYSYDIKGIRSYVSAIEAKKYPFYGIQFHPELFPYLEMRRISGPDNIRIAQKFANFFVNEARKNDNKMPIDELLEQVIWNKPRTNLGGGGYAYLYP